MSEQQQERLVALDAAMHLQKANIDRARNELRSFHRKEKRLRGSILDICFILFVWSAPSGALALAFAAHAENNKKCKVDVSEQMLEERYLQTPIGILSAIESRRGGASKAAIGQAARFEKEYNLLQWIKGHNDTKGIAPNTAMVKKHIAQHHVEPVATVLQHDTSEAGLVSTSWVQRFRKRWSLIRGRFSPGEHMSSDLISSKVGC